MSTIEFRRLTVDDMPALADFLGLNFGRGFFSRTECNVHRHFKNPVGDSIIYGAWDGDRLVGSCALQHCRFWIDGQTISVSHSFSSATHPAYRRELIKIEEKIETIYTRLNTLCREQAVQEDRRVAYGFPNGQAIVPAMKFAKYENAGRIPIHLGVFRLAEALSLKRPGWPKNFCRIIACLPQCLLTVRSSFLRKPKGAVHVAPVQRVNEDWNKLSEESARHYPIIQDRNANFLNWRFLEDPVLDYRMLEARQKGVLRGYLVYTVHPWPEREERQIPCGYVVDFLVMPDEEGEMVLYHLLAAARQEFITERAVIAASIHHVSERFDAVFRQSGFFVAPEKIAPRPVDFLVRSESDTLPPSVHGLKHWYLNLADNDII